MVQQDRNCDQPGLFPTEVLIPQSPLRPFHLIPKMPWIALTLAFTFSIYGLVKKLAPLGSVYWLTVETGILFVPAVLYLVYADVSGTGAFLHSNLTTNLLLIGSGAITTITLLMFASAAQSLPLSTIGIIDYIAPTLAFLLGVLVHKEPFDHAQLIGFVIVWVALALFAAEGIWARRSLPARPIPELD